MRDVAVGFSNLSATFLARSGSRSGWIFRRHDSSPFPVVFVESFRFVGSGKIYGRVVFHPQSKEIDSDTISSGVALNWVL